jgi:hypothetical protein
MGGAVSTRMRTTNPPSNTATSTTTTTTTTNTTTASNRPPMIVVQGRYDPYPGQADPNVSWITPRDNGTSPNGDMVKGSTPMANPGVGPSVAAPIPYTPEGGYPPVRSPPPPLLFLFFFLPTSLMFIL